MVKSFTLALSTVFLVYGILNIFVPALKLPLFHSFLHLAAGVLGIVFSFKLQPIKFLKWVALITPILSALGFFGVHSIFGLVRFTIPAYWLYLIVALVSIWVYLTERYDSKVSPVENI